MATTTQVNDHGAFTVAEFASWAGISRGTAYNEAQRGNLTLRKIGRRSVILKSEAQRWLHALPEMAA
jgi:hypothetical protein